MADVVDDDQSCKFYAIALFEYEPHDVEQLALVPGDLLAIVDDSALASTAWLGAINLDSQRSGWVSLNYLHRLDSRADADAYVQTRTKANPDDPDSLATLTQLVAASLIHDDSLSDSLDAPDAISRFNGQDPESFDVDDGQRDPDTLSIAPSVDDNTDQRSLLSVGGKSLISVATRATSGSVYSTLNPSLKSNSSDLGMGPHTGFNLGVDTFLRQHRIHPDSQEGGSSSGSGSSGSTIKSSYPSGSLRTARSNTSFYQANEGLPSTESFERRPPSLRSDRVGYHHMSQSLGSIPIIHPILGAQSALREPIVPVPATTPLRVLPPQPNQQYTHYTGAVAGPGPSSIAHAAALHSASTPGVRERPGLIIPSNIPSTRSNALGRNISPASLHPTSGSTTSPTRSISIASDSSGRSSLVSKGTGSLVSSTGMTTPSSHGSNLSAGQPSTSKLPTPTGLKLSGSRQGKAAETLSGLDYRVGRIPAAEELNLWEPPQSSGRAPSTSAYYELNSAVSPGGFTGDMPWYMAPSYMPHEMIVDAEGVVQAGTLDALVERLTSPQTRVNESEFEFRNIFLATYRSFTSARQLLILLAGRYEMTEPPGLAPEEFGEWRDRKLRPVQMKVLTVLTCWMRDHHMLDAESEEIPRVREFLSLIKSPEKQQKAAEAMLKTIDKEASSELDRLPSPLSPTSAVSPSSSLVNSSASSRHTTNSTISSTSSGSRRRPPAPGFRKRSNRTEITKFGPEEIAAQLTLMEHNMYSRISSNELITIATTPSNSEGTDVRNVHRFSLFNRKPVKMVKHVILTTEPVAKRRETLVHFIRIVEAIQKCRAYHNFASLHFLMVGITSSCLDKLTSTWQGIEKHQRLESLRTLTRSQDGYAGYKAAFDGVHAGACIPVIGIYVPTIGEIAKSDEYKLNDPNLINFAKCRAIAEVCSKALRFQGRGPPLASVAPSASSSSTSTTTSPSSTLTSSASILSSDADARVPIQENVEITQWIEEQFEVSSSLPEQWFTTKGADVLKREEEHSDIRKGLEAAGF